MAQIVVRQLDDTAIARLKVKARAAKTSVEAIARDAIHKAAELTIDDKLAIVECMQAWSRAARVPGAQQTLGVDLIRNDRDHDH